MGLYNLIDEKFLLPLADQVAATSIKSHFDSLNESQWWPKERLLDYQWEAFVL